MDTEYPHEIQDPFQNPIIPQYDTSSWCSSFILDNPKLQQFFLEGEKTQTMPVLKNFVDLGQPKPNSMTYMSKELYTKEHTLASRSDASAKYDTLHYLLTPRLTGYEGWGERATPPLPLPDPRLPPRLLHLPRPLSFWLRRKVL